MRKMILLFVSYICTHSLIAKLNINGSDESVVLNQKELEEDQKNTISSFETKLQLKAQAFYEELLEDQPIATQLKTLITDLIYYKDILIKTNYSYNHLLIYDQIIHFLKKINHLSLSESSLRNLSMNDTPSLSYPKNQSQITNDELMKICEKTIINTNLNTINPSETNTKYDEILNKTSLDRFILMTEIAEDQELKKEEENEKQLEILRKKEKNKTLSPKDKEEYKLLKNKKANQEIREKNNNQHVSEESKFLNNAKKRLINKTKVFENASPKILEETTYFFTLPNTNLIQEVLEFNKITHY